MIDSKAVIIVPVVAGKDGYHNDVLRKLADVFGGASCQPVDGVWIDDFGAVVYDRSHMIYSYFDISQHEDAAAVIEGIAQEVKRDLSQDAVLCGIENGASIKFV